MPLNVQPPAPQPENNNTPTNPQGGRLPVRPPSVQPSERTVSRDLDVELQEKMGDLVKDEDFVYREELLNRNEYQEVGKLTSEQVLVQDYDTHYKRLEEKILSVKTWLQETLTEAGKSEDVAAARKNRNSKEYKEIKQYLDQLLVRHFAQEQVANKNDSVIISAMVTNEILGLGPIEPLWQDKRITEIMVNGPYRVRVEIGGKLIDVKGVKFRDTTHLLDTCQQILAPLNKTIDIAHPLEDGRLPDGSRINITHPSVGPGGPFLTIRRFPETVFSMKKLVEMGSMTPEIAEEIGNLINAGCSTIISGGTGSGKQLDLNTLLPTPTGMTTMGDVQVGDFLLDENAEPTMVTAKYSTKVPVAYELTFSDGTKVIADEDHNWFTSTRAARRAWSRQKNEPKQVNAVRQRFGTDEEIATLTYIYNAREELISPSHIYSLVPRLRNVVYNATKTLPVMERQGKFVFYSSKDLLAEVIHRATAIQDDQRYKSAVESVVTTKEIFDTLKVNKGQHNNHAVRLISQPVEYSEKELLVSPYLFGAWLGDGYSKTGTLCGVDEEIFENIEKEGNTLHSTRYDKRPTRENMRIKTYVDLSQNLRKLNVLKTVDAVGESKFIPEDYLYSSIEQRRALIAGMLDTDGTVSKSKGTVEFSNTNKALVDGFRQVIHSLGYQSTVTSKIPSYTYNGVKKQGQVAYTVSFYTEDDVFRLSRKHEAHRSIRTAGQKGHRSDLRYIVDCQPVASVPMACVTVDSPKSLYLATDSFIPTHNTSMLNALSGCIPDDERIITIEDNLELRLHPKRDVVALEARRSHQGEKGSITIRDLVRNSLRMRPDRIVVGEVRDGSAYDMLQAMNTGHEGSMTTVHANDAYGAIDRLVNLISQVGELDARQALSLLSNGVDLIVSIRRYEDGSRRVESIAELPSRVNIDERGNSSLEPIILWEFRQTGLTADEKVVGEYVRVNEISDALKKKHRLDKKRRFSLAELYELSEQNN